MTSDTALPVDLGEQLHHAIDEYWRIAWREGAAGRTHDTAEGDAECVRAQIDRLINALPADAIGAIAADGARERVVARARDLLARVTYDSDGITIGHQRQGGNGGLLSTDSIKAADQLRLALEAHDNAPEVQR